MEDRDTGEALTLSSVQLIHAGLRNLGRARREIRILCEYAGTEDFVELLLVSLSATCDPDKALEALVHICQAHNEASAISSSSSDIVPNILRDDAQLANLVRVLGASQTMGRLMLHRPDLVLAAARGSESAEGLGELMPDSATGGGVSEGAAAAQIGLGQDLTRGRKGSRYSTAIDALRAVYRRKLAAIMAWDLREQDPLRIQPAVSQALSDLAETTIRSALALACKQVENSQFCRFTVVGMGKLGSRELNYVSDVDVIYVVAHTGVGQDDSLGKAAGTKEAGRTGKVGDAGNMATTATTVQVAAGESGNLARPSNRDKNRISDRQLIEVGTQIATELQQICQAVLPDSSEPPLWKVDTALRPEGKDGPLVRTLDSYRDYYRDWAQNWEFQALLKARPVAGDRLLGQEYVAMSQELVWSASMRENFVYDCQEMRSRVENLIPAKLKDREIKLGRGGLRDVEFTVQMLQLVHGRTDTSLRVSSTLDALDRLAKGGYISRSHADSLDRDYRFERVLEHRIQMWLLKRTHLFPDLGSHNRGGLESRRKLTLEELDKNDDLRRLARAFKVHPDQLVEQYDQARQEIRRLHLAIYFRPMLPIDAQLDDDEVSLQPEAARERFASIGFADPDAALRHVQALTHGLTRSAKINRILLPAVLSWLGKGQDPDMGLLGWRTLEERFGSKSTYLGFLRDSTSAARRLCYVLSNSRYLSAALCKSVESVTWLGSDQQLQPRSRQSLDVSCASYLARHADSLADFANSVRALRRREIERIGLGWLSRVCDEQACLTGMSDVYDAIITASLNWSVQAQLSQEQIDEAPASLCCIAMGRYGGREVNFSSDADAMLVYQACGSHPDHDAAIFAQAVCDKLRSILGSMSVSLEAKIDLDLDLRPEGRSGPLVRSLDSYRKYYQQWSSAWEHQALLRARPAAGDLALGQRFIEEIANPLRYPSQAVSSDDKAEIRKLKARMEAERLPRGVRRDRHLKLGAGGLSDVEWTVQLLQLEYAGRYPQLRVTSTMAALQALQEANLIGKTEAKILARDWHACTSARNGSYLWSGRASQADILPDDTYTLGAIAVYLGYPARRGQIFVDELLGAMRRAREVMERVFYSE